MSSTMPTIARYQFMIRATYEESICKPAAVYPYSCQDKWVNSEIIESAIR
jgi:hypothetical protein